MLLIKFKFKANYQYVILKLEEEGYIFSYNDDKLSIFCNEDCYLKINKYVESLKIDENEIESEYFSHDEYVNWHFHKYKLSDKTGKRPFFLFSNTYKRLVWIYLFIIFLALFFAYFFS